MSKLLPNLSPLWKGDSDSVKGKRNEANLKFFHFIFSRDGVVKRKKKGDRDRESNHRNKDRIEQSGNESCGVSEWWQHVIYSNSTSL
jgi:hypothetical protein